MIFGQTYDTLVTRLANPIWSWLHATTGSCYGFLPDERVSDQNAAIVRDAARTYIRKRGSGKAQSDVGDHDLLALMLKNQDVFAEDDMIDELVFLLAAG